MVAGFSLQGWTRFAFDPQVLNWAGHAHEAARAAIRDPDLAHWHQCQGTWFVGVDALDNDVRGRVAGSSPLVGQAVDFINSYLGGLGDLHKGQVSVIWPGYPRPRDGEDAAGFRYRRNRDAAHVDGLKRDVRARRIKEPHQYILSLPLNQTTGGAAPIVIWPGSHHIMRRAFLAALKGIDPADWDKVDLSAPYTKARRVAFETCERHEIRAQPGESYLIHRLMLHGVAPWAKDAVAEEAEGRMIAYFRPIISGGAKQWLAFDKPLEQTPLTLNV